MEYPEKIDKIKIAKDQGKLTGKNGKFLPGNPGGPGATSLTKERIKYQNILASAVTDQDFLEVSQKLLQLAKLGEAWAIKELLDRLLGKPKQVVDMDIKQTNVDPKILIQNIYMILGLEKEPEEPIEISAEDVKKISTIEE